MAGKGESPTSEKRIVAAERQATAIELRTAGKTYETIPRELGYYYSLRWV